MRFWGPSSVGALQLEELESLAVSRVFYSEPCYWFGLYTSCLGTWDPYAMVDAACAPTLGTLMDSARQDYAELPTVANYGMYPKSHSGSYHG